MYRPKKYNFTEALQRLRKYCAYQERCHQEVKNKLYEWGFDSEDSGRVIVQLMEERMINEERYTKAIIGGKFRQKGWGRVKITQALKAKGIVNNLIDYSMNEIDEVEYKKKLKSILLKKLGTLKAENDTIKKQKLARFGISKGYESDLVWAVVKEIEGDSFKSSI